MKASDLGNIQEPLTRFIQTHKFIRALEESREVALFVRDQTLLELRAQEKPIPFAELAKYLDVSKTRVINMVKEAEERGKTSTFPRYREWENEHQVDTGTD